MRAVLLLAFAVLAIVPLCGCYGTPTTTERRIQEERDRDAARGRRSIHPSCGFCD
jgi:hypothetical protein